MTEVRDDATVLAAFPHAAIDFDNVEFYRGLLARRFLVNRCAECGYWHVPARPLCPKCWSRRVVATQISGRGFVYMIVWLHGGEVVRPVATVELAEQPGLRISTTLTGCTKEETRVGLEVELDWIEQDGVPAPVFAPIGISRSRS